MPVRIAAVCVLIACAACARPAPPPPPAAPGVEETSTPTPFLPRGFTGVTPAAEARPATPQPAAGAESAEVAPNFALDQAAHGLNRFRQAEGLAGLRLQDDLSRLAEDRAIVLARNGILRHEADGAGALAALGFHGKLAGHAISVRADLEDPVGAALQALLTDPAHRANLLDPTFRYLGQGAATDGTWWYFVQLLAEHGPDG